MGRKRNAASNSDMPSYTQWERLSGGPRGRDLPLLKFIDKRMYEHSIVTRQVAQLNILKTERAACLVQLWNATRLYVKAVEGPSTFSRAKRSLVRADAGRVVSMGDGGRHNRNDAVAALHGIVADELMVLLLARNEADLKAKIRASAVHELDPTKRDECDYHSGRLVATYLDRDERAEHRVILENGLAWMHPRNPANSELGWVEANTCDAVHSMASFKNSCSLELVDELLNPGPDNEEPFDSEDSNQAAKIFWDRAYGARKCGIEGYVMTHGRKLYMSPEHKNGEFFHSAYTAGSSVVCSGSAIFVDGVPTLLTNLSGHYRPTPDKLDTVIRLFEMAGVLLDQLNLVIITPKGNHFFYDNVAKFRSARRTELA